ncbi:hypothetical protein KSI86_12010 [Dickeya oryzae]|uniref:hypothetical protein n=1 Tax=Dickeya oryzae TaxID=1240404 RepID=UPI0020975785|nr:hypothetical protein [Dickeya oryzae]MCO7254880.1 hypothetical protein [Dickeya oryzae]
MNVNRLVAGTLLMLLPLYGLAIAPYPADDSHAFTEAQRAEIRRIVMESLLAHPANGTANTLETMSGGCVPSHPIADNGKHSPCIDMRWVCPPQ